MAIQHLSMILAAVVSLTGTGGVQDERKSACATTITSPRPGEKHGPDVLVSGTASVPTGRYLWVFVHRKGLALWWPAGGGAATVERGQYAVLTTLGQPQDLGADFEIKTMVVDATVDAQLNAWFKTAEEKGSYPGIRLPAPADGCGAPPTVTVNKTR